jgi:hypothetical protein
MKSALKHQKKLNYNMLTEEMVFPITVKNCLQRYEMQRSILYTWRTGVILREKYGLNYCIVAIYQLPKQVSHDRSGKTGRIRRNLADPGERFVFFVITAGPYMNWHCPTTIEQALIRFIP